MTPLTPAEALAHLGSLRQFGYQPGLETTRRLAAALGNPERSLRFLHVAGTNGKGSTCAFLEAACRAAGLRTGLYTSPHLVRFGERIQVGRQPLPDEALARLTARVRDAAASLTPAIEPTFFEFTTLMALLWFAEQRCDVVVWETGLGGRLDATNIVTPLVSVITNIGLDHQRVLGGTLAEIAAEKAGIIKPGIPVVTATAPGDALAILQFKARELDAPFLHVDAPAVARLQLPVGLIGPHQRTNAALAAATLRLVRWTLPVSDAHLATGLATAVWPGRFQRVTRGGQTLILDGAHNLPGLEVLVETFAAQFHGRRGAVITAMLADKDWRPMCRKLSLLAERVETVTAASERAVPAKDLAQVYAEIPGGPPATAHPSLSAALAAVADEPLVLITGSLYFIGEALEHLGLMKPPAADERALNEWQPTRPSAR